MNCAQTKKNGQPCRAQALEGESLCFFHNPKVESERKAAWADGGKVTGLKIKRLIPTHLGEDAPDVELKTVADALVLAEKSANWILRGRIGPQVANALVSLIGAAIEAKKQGEFEARLKEIEEKLKADGG